MGSSSRLLPLDNVGISLWSPFGSGVIALLLDVATGLLSDEKLGLDIEVFGHSEGGSLDIILSTPFIQLEPDAFLCLAPATSELSFPSIPPSCLKARLAGRFILLTSGLRFLIFSLLPGTMLLSPAGEPLGGGDDDS